MLTVVSGPDSGLSKSFRKSRISVGREPINDFVLSDGFVSNKHGVFIVRPDDFQYQDLKSRHGTLVIVNNVSTQLHSRDLAPKIDIDDRTELQIGSSIVRFEIPERGKTLPPVEAETMRETSLTVADDVRAHQTQEQLITAAHEPIQALTRRFDSQDRRLELLFKLAEQLNTLTRIEDILDLIVSTTFDAFSGANFFSLTLLDEADKELPEPYMTRQRGNVLSDDEEPILSQSILRRVIDARESVLWVKDSMDVDVSQSILDAKITACLCAPLVGQRKLMGVMQVDTRGRGSLFSKQDLELFSVLASNAAFAVERAELSSNIVEMFESFVDASVTAIEARDPTTAGHSQRVSTYTMKLAEVVHESDEGVFKDVRFTEQQFTEMRYGTLLHDFGKIVVPAQVLQKATRLPELDMSVVKQRFETIKALTHRNLWRGYGENVTTGGFESSPMRMNAVEERYEEFARDLDETFAFLEAVNTKGFLPDEDLELVKSLGERVYVDGNGDRQPLLTPNEVKNLSIRKGTLNSEEWDLMQSHSAQSQRFLERIPWGEDLALIPYLGGAHHEKLDGSGYPLGMTADDLNVQVRMLTVADIFDALTAADRPYRKAASVERTVEILHLEADEGKLDKDLVVLFEEKVVPQILHLIPSLQVKA